MPPDRPSEPSPLPADGVRRLLAETCERHGPWTAHDIALGHGLSTGGPELSDARLRRVLTAIEDFCHKPLAELRILDLGALEGLFAIELARLGAHVVAVEARAANVARCRAAVTALGLGERVTVLEQDVRDVALASHGRFDVVLCLGILYHLDEPGVFRFVAALGELCRSLLVVDTHIALTDDELAQVADDELTVDPLRSLSGTRVARDDLGMARRGRTFFEHAAASTEDQRLASPWASLQARSFWMERETLTAVLADAGFGSLYHPVGEDRPDRVFLVAPRGDQRPSAAVARRLRAMRRPVVRADPPPPQPGAPAPAGGGHREEPLPDIVCFGIIAWEYRWQRPQQVLSRFARRGHRVFLLTFDGTTAEADGGYAIAEVAERVWEIRPAVAGLGLYERALSDGQAAQLLAVLGELAGEHAIGSDAIAMVQLPSWTPVALAARAEHGWTIVYDCMDEWDGFPGMSASVVETERTLVAEADAVTVSALPLWELMAPRAGNAVLVRNGGDPAHYDDPGEARPLAGLPRPIIGFVGGIAPWVDVDLVARAARERPDWTFVLVGDEATDVAALRTLANVHIEPRRPYALMPAYVRDFDVCMVPFVVDRITQAVDPVKVYEYFSLGKPVVSRSMPELERFGDLMYIAHDTGDFVGAIERALAETDLERPARRQALAAESDWEHRLDTMLAAVQRGRTRGYDRVRSWTLGRQLHGFGTVVVVGAPRATADVVRLRPELFVPEDASPDHGGAVLALTLEPEVVARARRLAARLGHADTFVLTRGRGHEVPFGRGDLVEAAGAALQQQGLALIDVVRLMWDDPQAPGRDLAATTRARTDAGTRELLLRVASAGEPPTVVALQEQVRHLRRQIEALTHGG